MDANSIASRIEALVQHRNRPYGEWTIGVTDNPARRRSEHENARGKAEWWSEWNADSEQAARSVEQHFLNKGMKGGAGGPGRADYVYVL